MKGRIFSEELRVAGYEIEFNVDETNFNKEVTRVITKGNTLSGEVITTNWGYPEGNISITLSNIELSESDYDILIDMKEDNSYTYLFCYYSSTWRVLIEAAMGVPIPGDRRICTITLSVIEKYVDAEIA